MPIDWSLIRLYWSWWLEGGILLIVTPFLLFPTVITAGTVLGLFLVIFVWLMPLISRHWSWPAITPFDLIMIGWGIVLAVSILVTADPQLTLPKATGVILGIAFWRFNNRIVQSTLILYGSMFFYGLIGIGFVFFGAISANWFAKVPFLADIISILPQARLLLPEASELGVHANQLAGTLLFYVPFLISIVMGFELRSSSIKIKGVWILLLVASLLLLLLTQSRTGWIAFAGSLFVITSLWSYALVDKRKLRRYLAAVSLGLVGLGVGIVLFIGPTRLLTIWQNPDQESVVGTLSTVGFRQEVWTWAMAAISDFPFTGIGLGSFQAVIRRFYPVNMEPSYIIAHAHNAYIQVAVDVGLPGLILYLAMVGLMFYVGLKVARESAELRPYAIGLLSSLAAFHIFGLFDTLALGSKPHLIFWVIFGLITAMHRVQQTLLQDNEAVLSLDQS